LQEAHKRPAREVREPYKAKIDIRTLDVIERQLCHFARSRALVLRVAAQEHRPELTPVTKEDAMERTATDAARGLRPLLTEQSSAHVNGDEMEQADRLRRRA